MKFPLAVLLISGFSYFLGLFLPWWTIAVVAFGVAWALRLSPGLAFLAGFLSVLALWGGLAAGINMANDGILASRVAALLPLGGSQVALIFLTGLVGGLVSGLAALSGALLHKPVQKQHKKYHF